MSRQRYWYAADAQFTADPKIAELGDVFGPGGPLAIVALHGLAKLQDEAGTVKVRYGALARAAFLRSTAEAEKIVRYAVDVEILGDFQNGGPEFTATFPHWKRWQGDRTAASRKRAQREREADSPLDDTLTAQVQEVFDYWKVIGRHLGARLTPERSRCIRARLRDYDVAFIKRAIDGCAGSDFHMGRDPQTEGKRYDDLTLICRNGSKLEGFAAMPPPPAPPEDSGEGLEDAYR